MSYSSDSWFNVTRRKALGMLLVGGGAVLSSCGLGDTGERAGAKGRILLNGLPQIPKGLEEAIQFPLLEAIYGRRSRRFFYGR